MGCQVCSYFALIFKDTIDNLQLFPLTGKIRKIDLIEYRMLKN